MSGAVCGGRRLVIRMSFPLARTESISRPTATIPSAGGSPSTVTVSTRLLLSAPNTMTAVCPAVSVLRLISLSAVATRT